MYGIRVLQFWSLLYWQYPRALSSCLCRIGWCWWGGFQVCSILVSLGRGIGPSGDRRCGICCSGREGSWLCGRHVAWGGDVSSSGVGEGISLLGSRDQLECAPLLMCSRGGLSSLVLSGTLVALWWVRIGCSGGVSKRCARVSRSWCRSVGWEDAFVRV
ncbi:hypothetical protein BJV78DRAFT_877733 [Lactifluus subvellereus]|nr:hypothetical protein BJV78DRAFT_877733 [Lactifluus subvellereus]